jgi:hypothetical protein
VSGLAWMYNHDAMLIGLFFIACSLAGVCRGHFSKGEFGTNRHSIRIADRNVFPPAER